MTRPAPRIVRRRGKPYAVPVSIALTTFSAFAALVAHAQVPASVFGSRAAQQTQQPQPAAQTPKPAVPQTMPGSVLQRPATAAPQTPAAMKTPSPVQTPSPLQNAAAKPGGARNVAELTKQSRVIIKADEMRAYSPRRNEILNHQIKLAADQNTLAQSLRAGSAALSPRNATLGPKPAAVALGNRGALLNSTFGSQGASDTTRATSYGSNILGITQVNGKSTGVTLTPGGAVSIAGHGFGAETGQVVLVAQQSPNRIPLQIGGWQDDAIYATLPPGVRGVRDQPAKLQVSTHAGKVYELDEAKFVAVREEVLLTNRLTQLIHLQPGGSWPDATLDDTGMVWRFEGKLEGTLDCHPVGMDRLLFAPPSGFEVTGIVMWHGRTDSGDQTAAGYPGSRVFFPGYSIGEWPDDGLRINWGVWRAHSSPAPPFTGAGDMCESNYQVAVSVAGPAGVTPL